MVSLARVYISKYAIPQAANARAVLTLSANPNLDPNPNPNQAANARAVLTLSADLTFRDYAQAAYRMRGIGKGQTLLLFVIPEVDHPTHRTTLLYLLTPNDT